MPELIFIVIVLMLFSIPVVVALALFWFFSQRKNPPRQPRNPPNTTDRLAELDSLRARNVITESEHEEKRRKILDEL